MQRIFKALTEQIPVEPDPQGAEATGIGRAGPLGWIEAHPAATAAVVGLVGTSAAIVAALVD